MKGYFIVIKSDEEKQGKDGYDIKIEGQIKAFNEEGLNCKEVVYYYKKDKSFWEALATRLPFVNIQPKLFLRDELRDADYIYMRRPLSNTIFLRRMFKKLKIINPNIKIIMELPTYPYDDELLQIKLGLLFLLKDKYNRKRLKGLVDRFAILTDEKEIWGIPTIKFMNGIDVNSIPKRMPIPVNENEIHICAVSTFQPWHGYERFIEGLHNYYQQGGRRKIICHFVGDGPEKNYYLRMINDYLLEDYFIFEGFLSGEKLNKIYNLCSLTLGSFGFYKIGLELSANLKSRDAIARGIPMITGCQTDVFDKSRFYYYLEFPNNSEIVDINKILEFYDDIYAHGEEIVINEIRNYALETVDMRSCMKPIVDYIVSN